MKILNLTLILSLLSSCGKPEGSSEGSTQLITFNFAQEKVLNQLKANLPEPADVNSINCIAVALDYPEFASTGSCAMTSGISLNASEIVGFSPITISGGAIQSATPLSMEVESGNDRRFTLLGMEVNTASLGSGCPSFQTDQKSISPYLSKVYRLGQVVTDVLPGTNNVNLQMSFVNGSTSKVSSCSGTFAGWREFEPTDLEDLVLWLDGMDADTLFTDDGCTTAATDGQNIGCWTDKSGNSNHATNVSGPQRPLYQSATHSLAFDNTVSTNLPTTLTIPTNGSIFAVAEHATDTPNTRVIAGADAAGDFLLLGINHNGGGDNIIGKAGTTTISNMGALDTTDDTPFVASFGWTSLTSTALFNQFTLLSSGAAAGTGIPSAPVIIGGHQSASVAEFWKGKIYEVLIFNSLLSDAERELVTQYLKNKWGVN